MKRNVTVVVLKIVLVLDSAAATVTVVASANSC